MRALNRKTQKAPANRFQHVFRTCRGNSQLVEFDVVGACKKTPPKIPEGWRQLSPACSVNDPSFCETAPNNLLHPVALAFAAGATPFPPTAQSHIQVVIQPP